MSRYPLPAAPPSFEDFTYHSAWTSPPADPSAPSSLAPFYRPVDAPRITPPPPSSLFATNESESLANFLDDLEDNTDFLFQPALPAEMADWGSLQSVDYGFGTLAPSELQRIDSIEPPESQPPSPKRHKMMDSLPPSAIMEDVKPIIAATPEPAPEPVSDAETARTRQYSRNTTTNYATSPAASASSQTSVDQKAAANKNRQLLTDDQKRSNHIQSEQKRRNAIRDGFAELVNILQAGEKSSGLSVGHDGDDGTGKKRGRGRGRKGEHSAGASKSVVLSQAVLYVHWIQAGNAALEEEVARLESLAGIPTQ